MRHWIRLGIAATTAVACIGAHAAITSFGGCDYTILGGLHDPHAPPPTGSCLSDPSTLSGIAGSFTTAGSASAGYQLTPVYGDLGFALSADAVASPANDPLADAIADARAQLRFDDLLKVTSPTLPLGSEVTLTFSGAVHGVADLSPASAPVTMDLGLESLFSLSGPADSAVVTLCRGTVSAQCDRMFDGDSASFSMTIRARVGDVLSLAGSLSGFLHIDVDASRAFPTGGGSAEFDALERTFVAPMSEDVVLIAQSGTNYAAPIPEPATLALMLAGLGFIVSRVHGSRAMQRARSVG